MTRFVFVSLAAAALLALTLGARQEAPAAKPTAPAPRAEDVSTVDGILGALYDVISGPPGEARDWDRMRSLFIPGARLLAVAPGRDGAPKRLRSFSVDDYVATSGPWLVKNGFFEQEIHRTMEHFAGVMHVMSTYEGRQGSPDAKPFLRGVNSIQLFNDGARWWVVTVFWEPESKDAPLPPRFLPGK